MELVAALVRIQQNARMTDAAFAETMDVPRTTWYGYKHGYPISLKFVRKALAAYPQVQQHAERLFAAHGSKKSPNGRTIRKARPVVKAS